MLPAASGRVVEEPVANEGVGLVPAVPHCKVNVSIALRLIPAAVVIVIVGAAAVAVVELSVGTLLVESAAQFSIVAPVGIPAKVNSN
jgi:hypothetical protein